MAALTRPECADFLQFLDILKKMRLLDDTIIYSLNAQLPTESFKAETDCQKSCKDLFEKLEANTKDREQTINRCMEYYGSRVSELKEKAKSDESNISLVKDLRKEQNKLRLLQTEQGVEEILKEKTSKVLYERCRPYYVPENLRF